MCQDLFGGKNLREAVRAITAAFLEDMEHYGPLRAEQEEVGFSFSRRTEPIVREALPIRGRGNEK
jgi:hypothetical protein